MPVVFLPARLRAVAAAVGVLAASIGLLSRLGAAPPTSAGATAVVLPDCRIKAIDQVVLASDLTGILEFIEPEEGDRVTAGQQIAGLRDEVPAAALAIAEKQASNDVEIRYSKKAAEVAEVEHRKAVEANQKRAKVIPEVEVERLRLAHERSVLAIEQAEYQFEVHGLQRDEARAQLRAFRIEAPFDGTVTQVFRSKGEAVRQGDPILEIVSTDRVRVEGKVPIAQVWNLKQGDRVLVELDRPSRIDGPPAKPVEGRIRFIDVSVEPINREVRVWAEVPNPHNVLRPGLTARMTIFPGERPATETTEAR